LEDELKGELVDPEDLSNPGKNSIDGVEESKNDLREREETRDRQRSSRSTLK